jgi:hypothetical protein
MSNLQNRTTPAVHLIQFQSLFIKTSGTGVLNILQYCRVVQDKVVASDDDDLHRHCHTRKGIGHALQAGEQATSSFFKVLVKGRWQEDACKFNQSSFSCVPTIRYNCDHKCVQTMRYNCAPFSSFIEQKPSKPHVSLNPHSACGPFSEDVGINYRSVILGNGVLSCQWKWGEGSRSNIL